MPKITTSLRPLPHSLARNRLSSQSHSTPTSRWLHASQRQLSPPNLQEAPETGGSSDRGDHVELTGAAKLWAEAKEEEEEEASQPRRVTRRPSVTVDDSPVWTGEESTRDAVLRMLVDSHKPLRGEFRSADARVKEIIKGIDTTPIIRSSTDSSSAPAISSYSGLAAPASSGGILEARPVSAAIGKERSIPASKFRPWDAQYVTNDRSTTPQVLYGKFINTKSTSRISLLDRPALPTDPKARKEAIEKRRVGAKIGRLEGAREGALDYRLGDGEGYQTKGSSAAGGGVRGGPSGMRAWGNLVEDRIERARQNGWFNNVPGRGQPIPSDINQNNPHIDRSEFFLNRIIQKQGAKPPWIEVMAELDHAQESFRTTLLASYTRSLVRGLITSPFHTYETLARMTEQEILGFRDSKWQLRESGYHNESISQINSLVRKMNNIAPQPVRRGLVTLKEELDRMHELSGKVVVEELAKRRKADWDKVKGTRKVDEEEERRWAAGNGVVDGDQTDWGFDLGIVKGVKSLISKTFRIHILGVGSIGTLLATHLRQTLQPADQYPITLMIRRRGLPDFDWPGYGTTPENYTAINPPTRQRPVRLSLERNKNVVSSTEFDVEVIGKVIKDAEKELGRQQSFASGSKWADLRFRTSLAAVKESPYISLEESIACLIVTLKCHQTLNALQKLKHRINRDSVIVLVQNGMGVYDELCDKIWPHPEERPDFVIGTTTHGAAVTELARGRSFPPTPSGQKVYAGKELLHRRVIHHGVGDITFGVVPDPRGKMDYDELLFPTYSSDRQSVVAVPPSPRLPIPDLASPTSHTQNLSKTLAILQSLVGLSPSLVPYNILQIQLFQKLCINCAINPLTALLEVRNGLLLHTVDAQWGRRMIGHIAKECSAIVLAYFKQVYRNAPNPSDTPPPEIMEMFSAEALKRKILQVCADTANNTSSMLSSIQKNEPTEIDYINGYMKRLGAQLCVMNDLNDMLVRRVVRKSRNRQDGMLRGRGGHGEKKADSLVAEDEGGGSR